MTIELLIGPLIERGGRFGYDTFTLAEGIRSSFRYARIDAARYDRRALLAEASANPAQNVRICETVEAFHEMIAAARAAQNDAAKPGEA
jgi:hypothetical protein